MKFEKQILELEKKLLNEVQKKPYDNDIVLSITNEISKFQKSQDNKIPFKVSARTARLIGRENIATSKGAIIELVKKHQKKIALFFIFLLAITLSFGVGYLLAKETSPAPIIIEKYSG